MPRSLRLAHKAPVMQARIRLTVFGLFCYCHCVIRQDHGFGSPSEPHRLPGWLCGLVAFSRASLVVLFCGENGKPSFPLSFEFGH